MSRVNIVQAAGPGAKTEDVEMDAGDLVSTDVYTVQGSVLRFYDEDVIMKHLRLRYLYLLRVSFTDILLYNMNDVVSEMSGSDSPHSVNSRLVIFTINIIISSMWTSSIRYRHQGELFIFLSSLLAILLTLIWPPVSIYNLLEPVDQHVAPESS